jgi:hypothetical protein
MRRSIRRAVLCALLGASITVIPATAASAHVHGITPLLQCSVDSPNSGATQTDDTPADDVIGPALIPNDPGQAPLSSGDGGFNAPVQCP